MKLGVWLPLPAVSARDVLVRLARRDPAARYPMYRTQLVDGELDIGSFVALAGGLRADQHLRRFGAA